MKKKLLTLLLATSLSLSLYACGGDDSSTNEEPETTDETEDVSEETNEETAVESSEESTEESEEAAPTEVSLEQQEVYNENGIVVTVTGLEIDSIWGTEISVLIENNSDQNITVQPRYGSVNGYMMDFQMSCDVAVEKKANDIISIYAEDLEKSGVDTISNIEFSLTIFDTDTWDGIADTDTISLTTNVSDYVQEYDDSGEVIYDENGIKIVSKGIVEDEIWGPEVILYIENNTDSNITVQPRNTSVNGFMVDGSMSSDIISGKKIVDEISFYTEDLEANNITEFENFEVSFAILDIDTWEDIATTNAITISFK